jgi:hypothetical protein
VYRERQKETEKERKTEKTMFFFIFFQGGNIEDYIRFLSCHLCGPVNHGQTWKGWERSGEKDD